MAHITHVRRVFNIIYDNITVVEEKLYACKKDCDCDNDCTCMLAKYVATYNHKWLDAMYKFSKSMQGFCPGVPVTTGRINTRGVISLAF